MWLRLSTNASVIHGRVMQTGHVFLVFAFGMAGCGGRSSLSDLDWSLVDGGSTSGTYPAGPSTRAKPDAGSPVGSDAAVTPQCTSWQGSIGAPVALTDTSEDSMLTGFAVESSRVFVATVTSGPTWRVRAVSDDLSSLGAQNVVLRGTRRTWYYGGLSVAAQYGRRGSLAWNDADGCRFVSLAQDGSPSAKPVTVGDNICFWLSATPTGFDAIESSSNWDAPYERVSLSDVGTVAQRKELVPARNGSTYPRGHAAFDDASMMLAWSSSGSVLIQRYSSAGEKISAAESLLAYRRDLDFALTSVGSAALAAWISDYTDGNLMVQSLGKDATTGRPAVVGTPGGSRVMSIGAAGTGALVAWVNPNENNSGYTLAIQPVTKAGALEGTVMTVPIRTANVVRIRVLGTPSGAMLLYEGEDTTLRNPRVQVFAIRVKCTTPH